MVDSKCGTNRYTGALFCEGDDILRNFVDYSCNDPATQGSFCSNEINAINVFSCTYACNEGSCVRCNVQSDCDDGNDGTVDICRFGGSIDSFCSHDVVSCFDDSECGSDSFIEAPFCIGDDLYQNFRDLSCENAGTSGSFCDADVNAELKESCSFGCSAGACKDEKECSNGEDDDNDGLIDSADPGCWDDPAIPSSYNPNLDDESRHGITCFNDFPDCGFDIVLFPPICEDNEVISRSDVPVCLNPGTGISQCAEITIIEVEEICTVDEVCLVDSCVNDCVDLDNDGFDDCQIGDPDDDGEVLDCDDDEFTTNPGAEDICHDGVDNNCDGQIDEGCPVDLDGDGFDNANPGDRGDDGKQLDCVDTNFDINPDAEEICNGIDDNCDGIVDIAIDICGLGNVCGFGSCSATECADLIDNDDDDLIDAQDPGCWDDQGDSTTYNPDLDDESTGIIVCSWDSDCGTDSISDEFCSEGDVVVDENTFNCLNPGTGLSSCQENDDRVIVDECLNGQVCLVDECVSLQCFDDVDNDDDNLVDEEDPGCWLDQSDPASYDPTLDDESDGTIICFTDSDCGTDSVSDDLCRDGDVVRDETTFTCENPGTGLSSCQEDTDEVLVDACSSNQNCVVDECVDICIPTPSVLNIPYTEDRIFLQDQGAINWNIYTCYFKFNGGYCSGLALKFHDSGASVTQLCRMKGYNTGTITSSGTWSSPGDNTIAYYSGGVWKTQSGSDGGNRHIDTIKCTNPINACL